MWHVPQQRVGGGQSHRDHEGQVEEQLMRTGLKVLAAAATHPADYAKTLMTIGFEPLPPVQTRSFLGKPVLKLPSVFRYIGVIKKRDGITGLYAGFYPKLAEMGVDHLVTEAFNQYWPPTDNQESLGQRDITDPEEQSLLARRITRLSAQRLACAILTQPLRVISVRCMAQFVAREHKYDTPISAIAEILEQNGILGFWSGFIPRALGEVSLVVLSTGLVHFINKYVLEKEQQYLSSHIGSFLASSLVYPMQVVSNCMIVSRSGLAAGYPPNMPLYQDWVDCYKHLSTNKQLKRGSSLFIRYYTGPQVVIGDRVVPVNSSSGLFKTQ